MAIVENDSLELAIRFANLFLKYNETKPTSINEFSSITGIPNTTIDNAFNKYLPVANQELYIKVRDALQINIYSVDEIVKLANEFIEYNAETNKGLRSFSDKISVSRSTLKGLFKKRLPKINIDLSTTILRILNENENKKLDQIDDIYEQTIELAERFIKYNSAQPLSLRSFADIVGIPRTNIRVRFDKILPKADPELYEEVRRILLGNRYNKMINLSQHNNIIKEERHIK